MNSAPYKATQAQREGSAALASFEEMGQLECDVIEWLFAENRFLRKMLEQRPKVQTADPKE